MSNGKSVVSLKPINRSKMPGKILAPATWPPVTPPPQPDNDFYYQQAQQTSGNLGKQMSSYFTALYAAFEKLDIHCKALETHFRL
jgi:hypothetical protein